MLLDLAEVGLSMGTAPGAGGGDELGKARRLIETGESRHGLEALERARPGSPGGYGAVREPMSPGGPGLAGVFGVWAMWIAVAAATWATNARMPVGVLYGVSGSGVRAGAGRVVVLLGWPVALAAVAVVAVVVDRFLASGPTPAASRAVVAVSLLSAGLCATVGLPGAVDAKHVDAKAINAPAAIGVAIAFGLSLWVLSATGRGRSPSRTPSDRYWLLLFAALLFAAVPWLLANLGSYAGDVPGLRAIFMSKQVIPERGYPHLAAVHLGNHDGLDGLLLALTSAVLARELGQMRRLRTVTGAYLALLLVYGVAVAASDWWLEQVVKRGWVSEKIPSVAMPSLSPAWAGIVIAALLVWLLQLAVLRRRGGTRLDAKT